MDKNKIKERLAILSEEKKPVGLTSTEKVQKESGKFNKDNQKEVAKEMKDYEKPIEAETEPVKYENSDEQQEYHDEMEIMNGLEMTRYDNKPNDTFQERAKMAIEGDAKMGNSPDYANVVTADQAGFTGPEFGKNLVKKIESSKKKRDAADVDNHYDNNTTSIDGKNSIKGKGEGKNIAISENKKQGMKRLVFKNEFKGVENALRLIPESYKVDKKEFQMTDGNEKYEIRWEGNLSEGRAIILKASDKELMNEDMQKMKHLMGYKSEETLGNLRGAARLDENSKFNDIWGKTKNLMTEMTGGYGFTDENNFEKEEEVMEEGEDFPDLTGDGKVTQADILKGRGVELDESGGHANMGSSMGFAGYKKPERVKKEGEVELSTLKKGDVFITSDGHDIEFRVWGKEPDGGVQVQYTDYKFNRPNYTMDPSTMVLKK